MSNGHTSPLDSRYPTVEFTTVEGMWVPKHPWPQTFYVSRVLYERDQFEVRPLTLTGFAKGVGKNLVTMNYWRFLVTLRILGFLTTPEACVLSWRDFTWRFWGSHRMWWRLRIVKAARRAWRWTDFYAWKAWNMTRYYWPQAQTRKRAGERLQAKYAEHGFEWEPPYPWWWPFMWWPKRRGDG